MQSCITGRGIKKACYGFRPLFHDIRKPLQQCRLSTTTPQKSDSDFDAARRWYKGFAESPIPRSIGDVTYSRSSGPGGQNVNKVNSKAQLRVSLDQLLPLLPKALHAGIRSSRYCTEKTSSLLIQSDESRKQASNKDTCYRRLNEIILDVYKNNVPGETSDEQKEKVRQLKRSENESRLQLKKHISNKKAARRGGND